MKAGEKIELQEYRLKKRIESKQFISTFIERWMFEDKALSWAAKGLLVYLVATQNEASSNEELWSLVPQEFIPQYKRAIRELVEADYIEFKGERP